MYMYAWHFFHVGGSLIIMHFSEKSDRTFVNQKFAHRVGGTTPSKFAPSKSPFQVTIIDFVVRFSYYSIFPIIIGLICYLNIRCCFFCFFFRIFLNRDSQKAVKISLQALNDSHALVKYCCCLFFYDQQHPQQDSPAFKDSSVRIFL